MNLYIWLFVLGLAKVQAAIQCNSSSSCPEEAPCCSQFGECGTGGYCLGGCNPQFSYNYKSCMAMPICKDTNTKFNKYRSKVLDKDTYLGNASAGDWAYSGYLMDYEDEESLLLAMPKDSSGTVLSSTRYVWYGKISARMKTSHRSGVVSAFILFSNVEDEVDNEWVGSDLNNVQTNYYFEGTLNYTHSRNSSANQTFSSFHTYEIDWREDKLMWLVDGKVGRTLYKNNTYNHTTKRYDYPQTPSRVQISLWPGGNSTNTNGTIAWAGGKIDWDASDLKNPGYYYMTLNEVNISCYDPPSYAKKNGSQAYSFTSDSTFLSENVALTDDQTMLYSSEGSGLEPKLGKDNDTSSRSSSKVTSTRATSSSLASGASTAFIQNINSGKSSSNSKNGGAVISKPGVLTLLALIWGYVV